MHVLSVEIEKFRTIHNKCFSLGEQITALLGQNGTMKTTLLGMIGEPFRYEYKDENGESYKIVGGGLFQLKFNDAFKFSDGPNGLERAGDHIWNVHIDPEIYPDEIYPARTIPRTNKEKNDIRTWSGETKIKGKKHVQFPCIYLSLKRLVPIGEEKRINHESIVLDEKEREWFEKYHRRILMIQDEMVDAELVKSNNKSTLGFVTNQYDSLTNSAGQDNIGKILLSILSFKRLKDKIGDLYTGGILLIDELDATLFPVSQKKLVEVLLRESKELELQIVFTTHSPDLIEVLYDKRYSSKCKTIYLDTLDRETEIHENLPLENILAHLRGKVIDSTGNSSSKINVFCEDDVARMFMRALVPTKLKRNLNYLNISLGHGDLNNLRKVKLKDLSKSIYVFDGDVNVDQKSYKAVNSLSLPGGACPEVVWFKFLKGLSERDQFWSNKPGEYSKKICFSGFETFDGDDPEEAKKWFIGQKQYFGQGCSYLLKRWKADHEDEVLKFQKDLENAYCSVVNM